MIRLHITLASAEPTSALDWALASRVARAACEAFRGVHVRVEVADVPRDRFTMRDAGRPVPAPRAQLEAIIAQTAAAFAAELEAAEAA